MHCKLMIASFPLRAAATGRYLLQKRKPVDIWGFVKTPYGLMMIFGLFVVFVVPKLKVGLGTASMCAQVQVPISLRAKMGCCW